MSQVIVNEELKQLIQRIVERISQNPDFFENNYSAMRLFMMDISHTQNNSTVRDVVGYTIQSILTLNENSRKRVISILDDAFRMVRGIDGLETAYKSRINSIGSQFVYSILQSLHSRISALEKRQSINSIGDPH